jgi:hypothetical protein
MGHLESEKEHEYIKGKYPCKAKACKIAKGMYSRFDVSLDRTQVNQRQGEWAYLHVSVSASTRLKKCTVVWQHSIALWRSNISSTFEPSMPGPG